MTAPSPAASLTIVVGYDDDAAGHAALDAAVDLATRLGASLHVVHVVDSTDYPADIDAADWESQAREQLARTRQHAQDQLQDTETAWTYHQLHGTPGDQLQHTADDLDAYLIIIGAHHDGLAERLHRLLDGSLGQHLTTHQRRPVLVVPDRTSHGHRQ